MSGQKKKAEAVSSVERWGTGVWVDETIPDLTDLLKGHDAIDQAAFNAWLGPKLGRFRYGSNYLSRVPTATATADMLAQFLAQAQALNDTLASGFPPRAEALLYTLALQRGQMNWIDVSQRIRSDLRVMIAVATIVEREARLAPTTRGRRPTIRRDALARKVVDWLRDAAPKMKATVRYQLAAQILVRCGVPMPDRKGVESHAIEKAVRRGNKLRPRRD